MSNIAELDSDDQSYPDWSKIDMYEELSMKWKEVSRILGPFCKRVLRSAASFPVIMTQQYLPQFLRGTFAIWLPNLLITALRSSKYISYHIYTMAIAERGDSFLEEIFIASHY